ncbi:MAG: ABC transporter substrate-binding protein [Desulfobulbaceae bacterium]|nr:ABC transporter substrate-binding protein [Desulfobulbaceae bacterium]
MIKRCIGGVILLSLAAFVVLAVERVSVASVAAPLEQIKSTVTGIIGVMQSKELGKPDKKNARREKIMAYVSQRFDFEEISKQTLAGKWRELSPDQRKNFERLFSELLKNTYIGRVEAYSDEVIQFEKEVFDGDQRSKVMVYTKVVKNNQEIPINYKLMAKNDDWFVYDVVIEGVSLVRNYRTEFARILNQEQYPGLLKRIQEKIDSREETKN